jgi:two-component system sensor histidine kinase TctE
MRSSSLRLNLMAWLVVPVAAILGFSLWLSYAAAYRQAMLILDRQLLSSARMIAEQVRFRDNAIGVIAPPAALELFASDSHDEVSYAVLDSAGDLIAGFPGLDPPARLPSGYDHRFFDTQFRTETMRAVVLSQPVVTPTATVPVVVMVGETLKSRDTLLRSLWLRGFLEQAALVLAAAASIWIGITFELRPMLRLRQNIRKRRADQFEPLDETTVQSELRPLITALNDHMTRLGIYLARQRRFLDSTAHQMRTPLTVMKTQVGLAARTETGPDTRAILSDLDGNLTALSRLINQLLTLAGVEHDRARQAADRVDLRETVRDLLAHLAPRGLDYGVELVLDAEISCVVKASSALLREAMTNLLENAILHAGAGAVATVSVKHEGSMGVVTVSDTGPGIAPEDRDKLFTRFYRGRAAPPGGSGLGLAIVAEIAEMYGGSVSLCQPPGGRGFCVALSLPLAPES